MRYPDACPNSIVINDGYLSVWWAAIWYNPMRFFPNKANKEGLAVPPSPLDSSITFLPTYHIKDMCKRRCSRSRYHCAHTLVQDASLLYWSKAAIPVVPSPLEVTRIQLRHVVAADPDTPIDAGLCCISR